MVAAEYRDSILQRRILPGSGVVFLQLRKTPVPLLLIVSVSCRRREETVFVQQEDNNKKSLSIQ